MRGRCATTTGRRTWGEESPTGIQRRPKLKSRGVTCTRLGDQLAAPRRCTSLLTASNRGTTFISIDAHTLYEHNQNRVLDHVASFIAGRLAN